jgi:hypothetical protein
MGQLQIAARIAKPANSPWECDLRPINDSMLAKKSDELREDHPIGYLSRIDGSFSAPEV